MRIMRIGLFLFHVICRIRASAHNGTGLKTLFRPPRGLVEGAAQVQVF
jgi:hypothetical protein